MTGRATPTPINASNVQSSSSSSSSASFSIPTPTPLVEAPSLAVLRTVAFTTGIPFIGFGIMDNGILILAGDAIDTSLGVILGISTLCAAAIGNIISDVAGIACGTLIEDFCANTLKLPVPQLSTAQRQLRSVRFAQQFGMGLGMTLGCIIGMLPLLFIDTNKTAKLREKARVETLFRDVVTEAKTLVDAESTCLYLRVDKDDNDDGQIGSSVGKKKKSGVSILPYRPNANGEYLYAMYYEVPSSPTTLALRGHKTGGAPVTDPSSSKDKALPSPSRILTVGRGIVSRAILTGDTWNISKVMEEPDFFPALPPSVSENHTDAHSDSQVDHQQQPRKEDYRNLVVVPILDGQGRAIAVLEAINKKVRRGSNQESGDGGNSGFSNEDVTILKSLASHISVSLQTLYQDAAGTDDDGESSVRLRDTIRILKEMGIQGISADGRDSTRSGSRRESSGPALFPSTSSSPSSVLRSKTSQLFPEEA
jgi:GAF domain-containing protein